MERKPMDVTMLIPFGLFTAWRKGDGSDASTVHKFYTRGVWRDRSPGARVLLLVRILFLWPLSTAVMTALGIAMNGAAARRRFGKPLWRQIAEQLHLAVRHSVPPPWYYVFGLWDDARRSKAPLYILRYETKGAIYRALRRVFDGSAKALRSKLGFDEICREHGLPVPSLVMLLSNGVVNRGKLPLPEADLFVKPVKARGGTGAERWEWRGDGRYRSHTGEVCTESQLVEQLAQRSHEKPLLVQRRVVNHPEITDLTTGALATARLMTALNEDEVPEVVWAVFRMGLDPSSPVDNYHAGGLVTGIDLETGALSQASAGGSPGMPRVAGFVRCDEHPRTGARIQGRKLPFWPEAMDLARSAHAAFPRVAVVGWDIALAPDGPVLIEGNSAPDVDLMQVGHQAPIGDTRFAAVLAHHLRRMSAKA